MRNILKIIRISKPFYFLAAFIAILILASSILSLVAPILSKFIVDEIIGKIQHNNGSMERLITLIAPTFLQSIFTVAILAYYNVPIALFTFILFPIYLILSYYSTVRWGKEEVRRNINRRNGINFTIGCSGKTAIICDVLHFNSSSGSGSRV